MYACMYVCAYVRTYAYVCMYSRTSLFQALLIKNPCYSQLSKADTLRTKATVRFREVSALERVQLQRYKCNLAGSGPNLLSGLERCPV